MVQQPRFSVAEQPLPPPIQLSELAGYQSFGAYLKTKREQLGITQDDMVEYLLEHNQSQFSRLVYLRLEAGRRAPQLVLTGDDQMNEIESIFKILVELHQTKRLPAIPAIEAKTFFFLAKKRILEKGKKRPKLTTEQWDEIEQTLIALADSRQTTIQPVPNTTSIQAREPDDSRRRQALDKLKDTDTSNLLEREEWVQRVQTYPDKDPQIKVGVIQAGMGAGKSRALALLAQQLAKREDLFLIPYLFEHSETMTADDQLDRFLATIYADLTLRVTDEAKQRPRAERIKQVLKTIRSLDQKVIILLDDAQEMFPTASEWSPAWHEFLDLFIDQLHQATIYVFTRTWPGWDKRERTFLVEDNLPELSIEAGVTIWERQEFDDVEKDLLRKVCERTGTNPQAIEMLAYQYRRRSFAKRWGQSHVRERAGKNPNTQSLEGLLESETLFSHNLDKTSRETLQQIFSNRFSGETMSLLQGLALAPLGIPFDLLYNQFDHADESFEDLVRASFADLGMAKTERAAVVPLVREAVLQSLTSARKEETEQVVTACYKHWLNVWQEFNNDAEKSALIAEVIVRDLRSRQMLDAAELFINFGWLCTLFGHVGRIQRVFEEVIRSDRGTQEDIQHEVGRLLLQYNISLKMGDKASQDWRDQTYQYIHEKVLAGEVHLLAYSEIDVLHHVLTMYLNKSLFADANLMLEETLTRLERNGQLSPEMLASFLDKKARLFAQWWSRIDPHANREKIQHLQQECIKTLKECITQWRLCLKNALPLQAHYYNFRLARALNDYAWRQRLVGNLVEAKPAIIECLNLKETVGALPHSKAASLSEYSVILALTGEIRKALPRHQEARALLEQLASDGNTSHNPELGVTLSEGATILMQQARLEEVKVLLDQAIPLIGNKPSLRLDRQRAEELRAEISLILETKQHYLLDKRWYPRYLELTSYDEVALMAQAGPFSDDEQAEWKSLFSQKENVSPRLKEIVARSHQREIALSQQEKRAPRLWYPYVSLDEVQDRLSKLKSLKEEIEKQETHAIVRSLYIDAIHEQTVALRQWEFTILGDQDAVWQCNRELYGEPNTREVYIALQALCKNALKAQSHEQAFPVAQDVLRQLKTWGLSPQEIATMEFSSSAQIPGASSEQELAEDGREFSPTVVQQFFQYVLNSAYHADGWIVEIDQTRTACFVNWNLRKLHLPPKPFSLKKIRELLAEEIETHIYRALSGAQSSFALLQLGLPGQLPTEEGLAKLFIQQVTQSVYGKQGGKDWTGTLATGLATGVLTPALSFYELALFLEKVFLVHRLTTIKSITWDDAVRSARQGAWSRACRTFRGVPQLEEAGCCSLKDNIYLHGYLAVKQALENYDEERLLVGKVGVEHLEIMSELNILTSRYQHHHLALLPDLLDRICQFEK
jgi:transcriptional regulator with XRE-family HTH domain